MEKEIKITYKKRRNSRAFKVWDTAYLYEAMQEAVHLKHAIEQVAEQGNTNISRMDALISMPSTTAYHICDALIMSYESLIKERLIVSGNISKIQPTLN